MKWLLWYGYYSLTQDVTAPASIGLLFTIPSGGVARILSIDLGKDDYAAGRTLTVNMLDISSNGLNMLMQLSADNVHMRGPYQTIDDQSTAGTADTLGGQIAPAYLGSGEILSIGGASLINTEVMKIKVRMLVTAVPAVSKIASSNTLTTTKEGVVGTIED